MATAEHDRSPGLSEAACEREAQALAGPGDESGASGEIEEGLGLVHGGWIIDGAGDLFRQNKRAERGRSGLIRCCPGRSGDTARQPNDPNALSRAFRKQSLQERRFVRAFKPDRLS